ncbi:MAG TPA: PAS domain-containing protein, partial [Gammaproteobacteria bacterium]|nr:PAS domain-containing protein [Gammaproteobacteria bacterium]
MTGSDQHSQLGADALREPHVMALADALPALIFIADATGRNRFANLRLQNYAGRPAQTFLGDGWLEVLHPEDRPRAALIWSRCVATGKPHEAEYRLAHHDGGYRWHLCRAEPVRDAAGDVAEWFGTCLDIEDRRGMEQAL